MEIYERINKIIKDKGLKKKDIANKLIDWDVRLKSTGEVVSEKAIYTYLNGNREIKVELLPYFAEALNVTPLDIFPNTEKNKLLVAKKEIEKQNIIKSVPIVRGYVGAGSGGLVEDNVFIDNIYIDINSLAKRYKNKQIKGIEVIGDSMYPYVSGGDLVLYSDVKSDFPKIDGKYIIRIREDLMLKNIKFKLNGDVIISSENKIYAEEIVKAGSQEEDIVKIIGVVAGRILKN